jgi:hypothetical protein
MLKKFTKKLTSKISNEVHNQVKLLNIESSDRLALISGKILSKMIKILNEFQPIREMWSGNQEFIHL